jgi:hypothetical protein
MLLVGLEEAKQTECSDEGGGHDVARGEEIDVPETQNNNWK